MRKFKKRKTVACKLNENKFSILDMIITTSLVLCIFIVALLMGSTRANAQVTTYGCHDPLADNYNPNASVGKQDQCIFFSIGQGRMYGFNTTAIASIQTPSLSTFNPNKLIVKYKEVGSNSWTVIKLKINEETFKHSGRVDTLGISFWYFNAKVSDNGVAVSDGNRYSVYVALNGLNTDTDYKVKTRFKGQSLIGGSNKTSWSSATDNTKSFMYQAPITTHPTLYNN